jgi:hypothetical protein
MIDATIQKDLLAQLAQLPEDMQRRVLDFARALTGFTPRGVPGSQLLQFVGTMTQQEAKEMLAAIEEDCERVDADEW